MGQVVAVIGQLLGCDEEKARTFCIQVQRQFEGGAPAFRVIEKSIEELGVSKPDPEAVAEHIRTSRGTVRRGKPRRAAKKGRSRPSVNWNSGSKKMYQVDESGAVVPEGLGEKPYSPDRRNRGKLAEGRSRSGSSMQRLKDKLQKIESEEEKRRADRLRRILSNQSAYLVSCPACGDRIRLDRIRGHCSEIHLGKLDDDAFLRLAMDSSKRRSE